MHLSKLEISGFKSFARATTLEFPSNVTGVVGPNGSGKSNIKEAIQWVLGEQSMKSLRARLGEDLIWNGSPQAPRMGKASVTLYFDNKDHKIPVDFDEVSITRKIFRDGLGEYAINNSQVRLKDVVELIARIGLGDTKHNIIGQGEVDRILLSSTRDRREMLEEALGLRVFQLKKHEAERKLEATENNVRQVEALVREIAPHLKFLRAQAQKAQTREMVEAELRQFQKLYFVKERYDIARERAQGDNAARPFLDRRGLVKQKIVELTKEIMEAEGRFATDDSQKDNEEKSLMQLESHRREIERELGRLEGKLEVERERARQPRIRVVDTGFIKSEIEGFIREIRALEENHDDTNLLRGHMRRLAEKLEKLLSNIDRGTIEEKESSDAAGIVHELERTIAAMQEEAAELEGKIKSLEGARMHYREKYRAIQQHIRELDSQLRAAQDEDRDIALQLERFRFDEERMMMREDRVREELVEAGMSETDLHGISLEGFETQATEELKKKTERFRGKLEEIGGIDPLVIKEYEEADARHSFLTKEIEDLTHASVTLRGLIRELDERVRHDFHEGFVKIRDEFQKLFRIIFGGGKATLNVIEKKKEKRQDNLADGLEEEKEEEEEGIDISVELPHKRIKGLAMLSGGERALTSIALLFAITSVNPPPFLILDETDAALDEANSQRYGAIIKELAQKTQLVIVTHNRETMKAAHILYGVTMGDDGVSKLLSLKFDEAEVFTNR